MAPPRARTQQDDSRSETSSTKEMKFAAAPLPTVNRGGRRQERAATVGSSLRETIIATPTCAPREYQDFSLGIQWQDFDSRVLHGYRYDYRLNSPAAFNKPYQQLVLSRSSIGRLSPTMTRRNEQRRQSKYQLAQVVRRHFNSMGINENDVVVDFLYKVRWQDKHFRMRFSPAR